jgi:hypothetical protein
MTTHLPAAMVPVALSTQNLVHYLQGLFGPLFLRIVGIVATFFLFTREITRFVQFIVLAVAIAVVFYTPSIVQVLTIRLARTSALATPRITLRIVSELSGKHRTRLYRSESSGRYAIP